MLGFSLTKILFTIAIVLIVWYGFKLVGQMDRKRRQEIKQAARDAMRRTTRPQAETAEDMVKCSRCGTYVAARGARSCGRGDCPYPG